MPSAVIPPLQRERQDQGDDDKVEEHEGDAREDIHPKVLRVRPRERKYPTHAACFPCMLTTLAEGHR